MFFLAVQTTDRRRLRLQAVNTRWGAVTLLLANVCQSLTYLQTEKRTLEGAAQAPAPNPLSGLAWEFSLIEFSVFVCPHLLKLLSAEVTSTHNVPNQEPSALLSRDARSYLLRLAVTTARLGFGSSEMDGWTSVFSLANPPISSVTIKQKNN